MFRRATPWLWIALLCGISAVPVLHAETEQAPQKHEELLLMEENLTKSGELLINDTSEVIEDLTADELSQFVPIDISEAELTGWRRAGYAMPKAMWLHWRAGEGQELPIDASGSIAVTDGHVLVAKSVLFEKDDFVEERFGTKIHFTSKINHHSDGILLLVLPKKDTNPLVTVTLGGHEESWNLDSFGYESWSMGVGLDLDVAMAEPNVLASIAYTLSSCLDIGFSQTHCELFRDAELRRDQWEDFRTRMKKRLNDERDVYLALMTEYKNKNQAQCTGEDQEHLAATMVRCFERALDEREQAYCEDLRAMLLRRCVLRAEEEANPTSPIEPDRCEPLAIQRNYLLCVQDAEDDTSAVAACEEKKNADTQFCEGVQVTWLKEATPERDEIVYCTEGYREYRRTLCMYRAETTNEKLTCDKQYNDLAKRCEQPDRRVFLEQKISLLREKISRLENGTFDDRIERMDAALLNSMKLSQLEALNRETLTDIDFSILQSLSPDLYTYLSASPEYLSGIQEDVVSEAALSVDNVDFRVLQRLWSLTERQAKNLVSAMKDLTQDERRAFAKTVIAFQKNPPKEILIHEAAHVQQIAKGAAAVSPQFHREYFENKGFMMGLLSRLEKQESSIRFQLPVEERGKVETIKNFLKNFVPYGETFQELKSRIDPLLTSLVEENASVDQINRALKELMDLKNEYEISLRDESYNRGALPFKDTSVNDWFTMYIRKAKQRNIISGYRDSAGVLLGVFGAGDSITQCEVLKIALEMVDVGPSTTGVRPAAEAAHGHWCEAYVKQAEDMGLTLAQGIEPDKKALRHQVVRVMVEVLGISPAEPSEMYFMDVVRSDEFAPYIQYAYEEGIVSGVNNSQRFAPYESITRAAVAKIVNNMLENIIDPLRSEELTDMFEREFEQAGVIEYDALDE